MQICSAHRGRPGRQWRQISNYAQNKINDGQAAIWQRRWWCVPVVEQHAEWGYLWSREVAMAGNWRQAGAAHFEEWLCALLACALASSSCPGTPSRLGGTPGRGGEAEKALIISIDCASSRARDTAASGQHRPRGCPPIILKTHRRFQKSPLTHRPPITQTLIAAEKWPQLCLFYQKWLLMQHRAQLVAIKLKKLPAYLMEAELAIIWKRRVQICGRVAVVRCYH